MFLSEVTAAFQLIHSFGSLCSSVYSAYSKVDPHHVLLDFLGDQLGSQLGNQVSTLHNLYISNKQSCLDLSKHVELLFPVLQVIQKHYAYATRCPHHLETCVKRLESTLKQAKELLKENILPSNLSRHKRLWWITKRLMQSSQIDGAFNTIKTDLSQIVSSLGVGLQIEVLQTVDETSNRMQQAMDYNELKDYLDRQKIQMDQMTMTLLQILEPRPDQETLLESKKYDPQLNEALQRVLKEQHQSQNLKLQECLDSMEQQIRKNGEWDDEFSTLRGQMQILEHTLSQYTTQIVNEVRDSRLQLQGSLDQHTRTIIYTLQRMFSERSPNEVDFTKNTENWKYVFKEFKLLDMELTFDDDNLLGHGTGGSVYRGKLGSKDIAFKRLNLPDETYNPLCKGLHDTELWIVFQSFYRK